MSKTALFSEYADRTGEADAAPGILAAVASAPLTFAFAVPKKVVLVDQGEFAVQSEVDLSGESVLFKGDGGVIKPDRSAGGALFKSKRGVLEFDGVEFDGGGGQSRRATSTTHIIFAGNASAYMDRVRIENCSFKNCNATDGQPHGTGLIVTHCIFLEGVTEAVIQGNRFDDISGAALFTKGVLDLRYSNNDHLNVRWYNVNLDYGTSGVLSDNRFDHNLTTGIYFGGAINTVNNKGKARNRDLIIERNTFAGYYSYGAVIRIQSDDGITIQDNNLLLCRNGSLAAGADELGHGSDLTGIAVTTRNPDGSTPSRPPRNIKILRNAGLLGFATGDYRVLIYVNNDFFGSRDPIENLEICGNVCDSPTASEYFTAIVLVHGLIGGVTDVTITNNIGRVYLKSSRPVPGAIGLIGSNLNGRIDRVTIGGNALFNFEAPNGSAQVGIQIGSWTRNVRNIEPNYVTGCRIGAS